MTPEARSRRLTASFRDLLIAASLKRQVAVVARGASGGDFPRSVDRGLIEADEIPALKKCHTCPFRDLLIAASLKHVPGVVKVRRNPIFPRSVDRGLIEASEPQETETGRSPFRDLLIAASLKPGRRTDVRGDVATFRDLLIAASIAESRGAACAGGRTGYRRASMRPRSTDRGKPEGITINRQSGFSFNEAAINRSRKGAAEDNHDPLFGRLQ